MQNATDYELVISDMYQVDSNQVVGTKAEIAIMDGDFEVDVISLSGKVGPGGSGYRKKYRGRPGLSALLKSGSCQFSFREKVKPAA